MRPIIKPFDSGWNYILHTFFNFISLLVIWSWKCNNVLKKKIISLQTSVIRVCQTTLNIIHHWIPKPCIKKHKNHSKTSSGSGNFLKNLLACKKSQYNVQNCKSWRHNQRHTFRRNELRYKPSLTNITYYGLKVKGRKNKRLKLYLLVDKIECFTKLSIVRILLFGILQVQYNLFYLSMNQTCVMITYSWIQNIMTNLLDIVILQQVVMQPTQKKQGV